MEGSIKVNIPPVSLKIVVATHFILTIWGDQIGWLPGTYVFCNLLVLAVGVWAIASTDNEDASQMFLIGMLFTILHDIIVIAIYYNPDHPRFPNEGPHYRFCVGFLARMAILSLILKMIPFKLSGFFLILCSTYHGQSTKSASPDSPLSCLLIFQNHRSRGGAQGYSWTGTPYVTIEGQTSSQPAPGYAPPPAPGNPSQS